MNELLELPELYWTSEDGEGSEASIDMAVSQQDREAYNATRAQTTAWIDWIHTPARQSIPVQPSSYLM